MPHWDLLFVNVFIVAVVITLEKAFQQLTYCDIGKIVYYFVGIYCLHLLTPRLLRLTISALTEYHAHTCTSIIRWFEASVVSRGNTFSNCLWPHLHIICISHRPHLLSVGWIPNHSLWHRLYCTYKYVALTRILVL